MQVLQMQELLLYCHVIFFHRFRHLTKLAPCLLGLCPRAKPFQMQSQMQNQMQNPHTVHFFLFITEFIRQYCPICVAKRRHPCRYGILNSPPFA